MGMYFMGKTILITGAAGFIGFHLARHILVKSPLARVVALDSLNDYYDVSLKMDRLHMLQETAIGADTGSFVFVKGNLADRPLVDSVFEEYRPDIIVNLAAQAGVRYSLSHPEAYIEANVVGFFHILEACRRLGAGHLIYASSSSVYGNNKKVPYSTKDRTDRPVSLYAATKKSDELLAYSYSKLYGIPMTGLRFFTVYGPFGRPDMAYFKFTDKLIKGEKIPVYNYGDMYRDFTYIDDIVQGIENVMNKAPEPDDGGVRHKIYNIGNGNPEKLLDFIEILENALLEENIIDKKGVKELLPMQPGDVYQTYADIAEMEKDFGFVSRIGLKEGLAQYAKWYAGYYGRKVLHGDRRI